MIIELVKVVCYNFSRKIFVCVLLPNLSRFLDATLIGSVLTILKIFFFSLFFESYESLLVNIVGTVSINDIIKEQIKKVIVMAVTTTHK